MVFSSLEFMFVFLPLAFLIYFLLSHYVSFFSAKLSLAASSLVFYGWWDWRYLFLLLFSIIFNYVISDRITQARNKNKNSKSYLVFALIVNIGLLCYFKYMDFFIENINFIAHTHIPLLHIVLPLGISFFTITQIAYLVDCYEGLVEEKNLINYTLFVTFFPHLIAGPILHHKPMMSQFADSKNRFFNAENFAKGLFIFSIGLFKKSVVADSFAQWANAGFGLVESHQGLNIFEAWGSALSYSLQLYFDFSGYCDMALGLGLFFNIMLPINFNSPYRATNLIDFWKRWHISLTNFITTYIYTPIVRSFAKPTFNKILLATLITFIIAGVWHGSGWNFFIFGCLHGLGLVINHFWQKKVKIKMPKILGWLLMMLLVVVSQVFFRAKDFTSAMSLLGSMFGISSIPLPEKFYRIPSVLEKLHMTEFGVICIVGGFLFCIFVKNSIEYLNVFKPRASFVFLSVVFLACGILACGGMVYKEFIYFNF